MQSRLEATTSHKIDPLEVCSLTKKIENLICVNSQLPAARFCYMKWTDIDNVKTTGPELGTSFTSIIKISSLFLKIVLFFQSNYLTK